LLPAGAPLMLHSIVYPEWEAQKELNLNWTEGDVTFVKFIQRKIFPGGQLRPCSVLCRYGKEAGFEVEKIQSLRPHYAKTLDCWSSALEANCERAIELTSPEVYETYLRYMTGCAARFHVNKVDVVKISFRKPR